MARSKPKSEYQLISSLYTKAKDAIDSSLQIVDFAQAHGITTEESGQRIRCPFHDDSDPSMVIDYENNRFNCFGCKAGGRFVEFYAKYREVYDGEQISKPKVVDEILAANPEIVAELGFATVFRHIMDTAPEFQGLQPIPYATPRRLDSSRGTRTISQVMRLLRREPVERIMEFVADCELGFTYDMLVRKYLLGEDFTVVLPVTLPPPEITAHLQSILAEMDEEDDD